MESCSKIRTGLAGNQLYLFTNNARRLMLSGRYSDVTIYNTRNLSDTKFHFSKLVIASLSEYFGDLLITHQDQRYIGIPGGLYKGVISNILIGMGATISMHEGDHKAFLQAKSKYKFMSNVMYEADTGYLNLKPNIPVEPSPKVDPLQAACNGRQPHPIPSTSSATGPVNQTCVASVKDSHQDDDIKLLRDYGGSRQNDSILLGQSGLLTPITSSTDVNADPNLNESSAGHLPIPPLESVISVPDCLSDPSFIQSELEKDLTESLERYASLPFPALNEETESLERYASLPFPTLNEETEGILHAQDIDSSTQLTTSISLGTNSAEINVIQSHSTQPHTTSFSNVQRPLSSKKHCPVITLDKKPPNIRPNSSDKSVLRVPNSPDKASVKDVLLGPLTMTTNQMTAKKHKMQNKGLDILTGLKRRCNYCKKLVKRDNLERHLAVCHSCEPCGVEFISRPELQAHLTTFHSKDSRFVCDKCCRLYNSNYIMSHRKRCKLRTPDSEDESYTPKSPTI